MRLFNIIIYVIVISSCGDKHEKKCFKIYQPDLLICTDTGFYEVSPPEKSFGPSDDAKEIYLINNSKKEDIHVYAQVERSPKYSQFDEESYRYWLNYKQVLYKEISNLDTISKNGRMYISFTENNNYHMEVTIIIANYMIQYSYIKHDANNKVAFYKCRAEEISNSIEIVRSSK